MLNKNQSLVIHFDAQIDQTNGKMGHSVLRYSENPVACVIERNHGGHRTRELLNFGPDVPIVSSVAEALPYAPEALLCLLYTSPSPRDRTRSRMPSSA